MSELSHFGFKIVCQKRLRFLNKTYNSINMIFRLTHPTTSELESIIQEQKDLPFTYTKTLEGLKGYDNDANRILLGEGTDTFEAAKQALRTWTMFPGGWARIFCDRTPIQVGRVVVMTANVLGLWWVNAARIVYTVDELKDFGFAYGTLPHHVESGEELFHVFIDDKDQVWYEIKAFSRPRHILPRLFYPMARFFQKKFVKASMLNMKEITYENLQFAEPTMVC
jgi:uncharacterized protein (UPF0548 family)